MVKFVLKSCPFPSTMVFRITQFILQATLTFSKNFRFGYLICCISDSQANIRTPVVSEEIKPKCRQLPASSQDHELAANARN